MVSCYSACGWVAGEEGQFGGLGRRSCVVEAGLAHGKSGGAWRGVQATLRSGGRCGTCRRRLHRRLASGKMVNSGELLAAAQGTESKKKTWGWRGERGGSSGGLYYRLERAGRSDDQEEILWLCCTMEEDSEVVVVRKGGSWRGRGGTEEVPEATASPFLRSTRRWPKLHSGE